MVQQPRQQSDHAEQEYAEEPFPEEEQENRSGTPFSTWVAVFGSSAVFHVLLLILLGLIIIGEPTEEQEEVTVQIPQEEEEEEEIEMQKTETEVESESQVQKPEVEKESQEKMENRRRPQKAGESLDVTSDTANNKKADRAIALGGGGGGGTYGRRGGGNANVDGGGSGSPETEHAVDAALKWLARHQNDEGYWEVNKYDEQCPSGNKCERFVDKRSRNNVGVTGLSLLAFLGAGYTHQSDEKLGGIHMGDVVRKGLRWLKKTQKDNGAFSGGHYRQIYNHSIAAMAYAEAYGMTGSPRLEEIAQKGVDYLEKIQNESGGNKLAWRYYPNDGENDTSVTGWCTMALKSAQLAGLDTSKEAMKGALRWVKQTTNKKGLTGYKGKITSRDEAFKRRAMTPVGMMIRMFASYKLGDEDIQILKQGSRFLMNNLPEWEERAEFDDGHGTSRMDYYHWYYGSLALFMFAGPDTQFEHLGFWQKWNKPMKRAVLAGQQKAEAGHEKGSWDPVSRWSSHGGRVYTTALNALTLEVYYRYDNALFQ